MVNSMEEVDKIEKDWNSFKGGPLVALVAPEEYDGDVSLT